MSKEVRNFFTIAQPAETRTNIKGSIFIAHSSRVGEAAAALAFIESIRAQHKDATHNCWAYCISKQEYRFNDDGEPAGTAGQPILQAITTMDLEQVCVVVTRYFGGVKLGAGGLVRAYHGAAVAVLKISATILVKPEITLRLELPFAQQHSLYHFLETHPEISASPADYTNTGLQLTIKLNLEDRARLESELNDALCGRLHISESD
ncbi:MAG: YigZ family protein [Acidobacteriota bacterium]